MRKRGIITLIVFAILVSLLAVSSSTVTPSVTHTDAASGPIRLADSIPSDTPTPDVSGTVVAQQTVDAGVQQTATVAAQQTVDAATQQTAAAAAQQTADAATAEAQQTATAEAQQTVDAATAEAQQTATAEAQQTVDAATAEAQQTATAEAQQTATAIAQQTATAGAQQTATAATQQTATAAAQQTATSIALATNIAGTLAFKQAIISARQTSIAQATIAAQQTATTIAQQTATTIAQQTATTIAQQTATTIAQQTATTIAQQTAVAASQQTAVAQQAAAAAAIAAASTAAAQQTAASQQTAVAASQQTAVAQQAAAAAAIAAASTAAAQQTAVAQQHVALPSTPGGTKQTDTGTSGSGVSVSPTPTDIVVVVSGTRSYQSTTLQPTSVPTVTAPRPASPTPSTIPGRTSTAKPGAGSTYKGNRPPSHPMAPTVPHLTVSVLSPLVKPGALQQIQVSYVEGALVQTRATFPHTRPVMLYSLTDAHGRLDTAVRVPSDVSLLNGRATGSISIHAVSGPWQQLKQFPLLLKTSATARMTITYRPSVYIRANIQFPGTVSRSLLDKTDIHGHVAFLVQVPTNVPVHGTHVTAHVTMWALSDTRHADATVSTIVSDMVLVADHSAISNCMQVHTFHVSYAPHVPVKLRLTFPHHYQLLLGATTDRQGNATMHVKVFYKRSHNPVLFGAQAYDARFGKQRSEHITVTASLPSVCQS